MSNTNKPRPTIKAVRGTRDLLPDQTPLWNKVEATARAVFARYGFGEIRTPIFESTELFARGVGEETDIVSKEMFTWEDGERFDKQAIMKVWIAKQVAFNLDQSREFHGANLIDLVLCDKSGESVQFVIFRPERDRFSIDTLMKVLSVNAEGNQHKVKSFEGILVIPQERNTGPEIPHSNTQEPKQTFLIEGTVGKFFASSQSLTLRPESTAGVVRAYIEHKLGETGQLQKLYYIGPQFRRERPQRGRYRQFWQIGAEVLGPQTSGSDSPLRDAEILEMLASLLDELGIRDWKLELNSVGNTEDRARYNIALKEALAPVKHLMCPDNQRRAETNPLRVLDSKDEADQEIINALPKIADYLGPDSAAHFQQVLAALDACGVPYHLNPRLVRGLDYYTRTTFEFTVTTGLGTQNAMLGGGRYDGLSEMLGGPKAPGIGFAIGEDRLILTLQAQNEADIKAAQEAGAATGAGAPDLSHLEIGVPKLDAYIAPLGIAQNPAALKLARDLRAQGLTIEVGDGSFKIGKSFGFADAIARNIILLGEDEVASNTATVKTFATGEQVKVPRQDLAKALA